MSKLVHQHSRKVKNNHLMLWICNIFLAGFGNQKCRYDSNLMYILKRIFLHCMYNSQSILDLSLNVLSSDIGEFELKRTGERLIFYDIPFYPSRKLKGCDKITLEPFSWSFDFVSFLLALCF